MSYRRRSKYSLENLLYQLGALLAGYIGFLIITKNHGVTTTGAYIPKVEVFVPAWVWAVLVLLAEIVIIAFAYQIYEQLKIYWAGLPEIDKMTGEQFEKYLVILFQKLGYSVDHFSQSHPGNEYGTDLIITKDGQKTAVQAKRYRQIEHVDNTAVEKLVAAKAMFNCDHALVVTNSSFTENAHYAANKLNVELWGRKELANYILESNKSSN